MKIKAKIQCLTVFFIIGLILSGVTAFPLLWELNLLSSWIANESGSLNPEHYEHIRHWILKVRVGLEDTYQKYPFIAYGTDWLAFGHIVIALFFIPTLRDPIRYKGNYDIGIVASFLVIPLAFICGHIRDIPIAWRCVDCLFGLGALPPLCYIKHLIGKTKQDHS